MTAPKPRGRAFKMPEPDLLAAISAWREAYETDPRVTHCTIAESIGVSKRVRELGWVAPDAVKRARKGGHLEDFPQAPHPTEYKRLEIAPRARSGPSRAPASIWQLARGASTTAARHGGRHVEVTA